MKTLELTQLDALEGGSTPGSCFAFGFGLAVVALNWYNPLAVAGAQLAVVGAVGCFG
jgi:hypothetical protein